MIFKQFITGLIGLLLIASCSYFERASKKEDIPVIDTVIDFNTVDAFPLFPNCKDIPSREKQQVCFQLEMAQHIYASLKEYELNAKENIEDTVLVQLKVDAQGKTSLSKIQIGDKTRQLLPKFDSIVIVSLEKLPDLKPAIKRNMPVTTEFTLPIVLKN
jgi:hypothetical protein